MEDGLEFKDPLQKAVLLAIVIFTVATMSFGATAAPAPTHVVVSEYPETQSSDTVAGNIWRSFGVGRASDSRLTFSEVFHFVESDIRSIRIHQGNTLGDWRTVDSVENHRQARSNRLWLLVSFKDGSAATLKFDGVPAKEINRLYQSSRPVKKTMTRAVANGNSGQTVLTELVGKKYSGYPQLLKPEMLSRVLGRRAVRVDGSVATQLSSATGSSVTTSVDIATF